MAKFLTADCVENYCKNTGGQLFDLVLKTKKISRVDGVDTTRDFFDIHNKRTKKTIEANISIAKITKHKKTGYNEVLFSSMYISIKTILQQPIYNFSIDEIEKDIAQLKQKILKECIDKELSA